MVMGKIIHIALQEFSYLVAGVRRTTITPESIALNGYGQEPGRVNHAPRKTPAVLPQLSIIESVIHDSNTIILEGITLQICGS